MSVEQLNLALLVGVGVLLVAVGAVRLSVGFGLPSLLVYLGLGLALGVDGLGVSFDNAQLARNLGLAALVLILAEGGLSSRWQDVRPGLPMAGVLATVGVAVSIAVTAIGVRLVLHSSWRLALLLAAVVTPTDAAAVFATLRRLRLRPRTVAVLEAESGINDAPVVIVVVLLSSAGWSGHPLWQLALLFCYELAGGAAIGLASGALGVWLLRRSALPAAGLYPISVLGFAVLGYAAAASAHASGFLAVYVAALVLGNAELPHRRASVGFAEGVAWLAQIGMFVMLGLLAEPSRLGKEILPALAIGAVLTVLARPLSVLVSALPFRLGLREQAFLSWAGLRGAVPIVLATIPVTAGLDGQRRLFDVVFVLVIVFTLVQGPLLAPLARVLGLAASAEPRELGVESAPLEDMHADLLQLTVPGQSRLHGVEIGELRLPRGAAVTLVVRDGNSFVPDPRTVLQERDQVLVVATVGARTATLRRFRAVSRRGRLAGWYGERGDERPAD